MAALKNMVRISWRKFWRVKGSWYQIGMLGCCYLLMQWALWAKQLMRSSGLEKGDQLTALLLGALDVMCWVIALILLVIVLLIPQLKLADQRKYLAMLKAIGYTDIQVTMLQMLELMIAMLSAWAGTMIIALVGEVLMVKWLWTKTEMVLSVGSSALLQIHLQVLALFIAVYAVSAGVFWFVIRRVKQH